MNCLQSWPEPVVSVQSLAESGLHAIPERYIKPPSQRPILFHKNSNINVRDPSIPVIDFQHLFSEDHALRKETMDKIFDACHEWGFFQVVNHGVSHELLGKIREVWREFFNLPVEIKKEYANNPVTYEGFGSRLGVEKGACLDWNDYFFLHFLPVSLQNQNKWPKIPSSCREMIAEYGTEVVKLGRKLMKVFSMNLGLEEDYLQDAFGGDDNSACLRVNLYPKCPQPDLTLGLSPHSDPGGMTILLPEENVDGLQVRKNDNWVTVKPVPNAFIINIGDQIQVLSNAIYHSVEHRVIVNSEKDRVSLAFFYNPKGDIPIGPCKELVTEDRPALYSSITYDEYRVFIRTRGLRGKKQVESLKSI